MIRIRRTVPNCLVRGMPNYTSNQPGCFQHENGTSVREKKWEEEREDRGNERKKKSKRPLEAVGGPPKLHSPPIEENKETERKGEGDIGMEVVESGEAGSGCRRAIKALEGQDVPPALRQIKIRMIILISIAILFFYPILWRPPRPPTATTNLLAPLSLFLSLSQFKVFHSSNHPRASAAL